MEGHIEGREMEREAPVSPKTPRNRFRFSVRTMFGTLACMHMGITLRCRTRRAQSLLRRMQTSGAMRLAIAPYRTYQEACRKNDP